MQPIMACRLLCISNDEVLMRTRKLLFEREGYEVTNALGFVAASASVSAGDFDVVFIGHSVLLPDARELIRAFRDHSDAPIVTVRSPVEDWPAGVTAIPDVRILIVGDGPQIVLDAVHDAVKSRC